MSAVFNVFHFPPKFNVSNSATLLLKRGCASLMKAVLLQEHGGADVLKLKEIPRPVAENSEVLVKVHAAGVNRVDIHMREGAFARMPPLPLVLGKEVSGIIEHIGDSVKEFEVGDRVVCCLPFDGGYAEYVKCDEKYVIPLSKDLTFCQGATLYVAYFAAYRALITKCRIKRGEKVLIHGASGGVGIASVQIAKSRGLTVFGTAGSEEGMKVLKEAGADYIFNHKEKDYLFSMASEVSVNGFDVILENVADENLGRDLNLLAKKGRIAVVGTGGSLKNNNDKRSLSVPVNPRFLIYTEGVIYGINLIAMTEDDFTATRNDIMRGVEEGWLRPIVSREFKLSQAEYAHKQLEAIGSHSGKIVLNLML